MRVVNPLVVAFLVLPILLLVASCGDGATRTEGTQPPIDVEVSEESLPVQRASRDVRREQRRQEDRLAAERAAREAATQLDFMNYAIDVTGPSPLACLAFSLPLDPETDYSVFIESKIDVPLSFNVDGQKLCLGGLEFGSETKLTLREGLPDLYGTRVLPFDEDVTIAFDDRPAYVGFSGNGIILPRTSADGLAFETVNVQELKVEIRHITDRSLVFKRLTKGITVAPNDYEYLRRDENPSDLDVLVWSGSVQTEGPLNATKTTVFPIQSLLDELKPGAYYVKIKDAKSTDRNRYRSNAARAERWILVTDLALTAYKSEAALDVVLRSLQDGRVVQGVETLLLAENNEILAKSETGLNGLVRFDGALLGGKGKLRPALLIAYGAQGDIALLDLRRSPVDLSEALPNARTPNTPVDSYVYTDRGIYRPGESVHITGLIRGRNANALVQEAGQIVIYRPNGVEAFRQRFSDSMIGGSAAATYEIPRGSLRGVWRVALFTDRSEAPAGAAQFSVEDFVPQRIAVDVSTGDSLPLKKGDTTTLTTDVKFLYGAPASGLTVETTGRLEVDPRPFEALKGYVFGDHSKNFREKFLEFDKRTTDGNGHAEFRVGAGTRAAAERKPLRLNLNVSAFEPGGRAVTESVRIPYRPRTRYIGIKPDKDSIEDKDTPANFDLTLVDNEGNIKRGQLEWELLRIDYDYDWYRENGRWKYRRTKSAKIVNSGVVNITDAIQPLQIDYDWDWGRYVLSVKGPRGSRTSHGFWIGWRDSGADDGVEAPDRIQIMHEDGVAIAGREATISFKAPFEGEAQIVVASDRVLSITDIKVDSDIKTVKLPVTAEWGEGAYVTINAYSKRDPIKSPKPRRAVGVQYVAVDTSKRTFDVSLDAPEKTTPRKTLNVGVRVSDGPKRESVYVTLAAVDEGILRITKYQSPDPLKHYFSPKSLGVDLFDDYGRLLNPNLGLPAEVRSGGDQLGGEGLSAVPTKSVALFSGVVLLKNGRAEIPLTIPDFNGSLRLMAVVWSETGLGQAEQTMVVRDPAPSTLILPRFMAPGDSATATLSVDNVELPAGEFVAEVSSGSEASMRLENAKPVRVLETGQRADVPINLASKDIGISNLTLKLQGPNNFAVRHDYQLQTRAAYLPVTRLSSVFLDGETVLTLGLDNIKGLKPESVQAEVTFSDFPVDKGALFKALEQYPYGCTEQTVSRAAPLLYASYTEGDAQTGRLNSQVQKAINTLLERQGRNGAIHLWRAGDNLASPWLGAYTVDFLARAKAAGYVVPQTSLRSAMDSLHPVAEEERWQISGYDVDIRASRWHNDNTKKLLERASSYALYVLAKDGQADASRLRYMHDRRLNEIPSPLALAHLGTGLAIIGDRVRSESAFAAAIKALGYNNTGDYYQTPLRDLAGVLALAVEANMPSVIAELQQKLREEVRDPQNLSTQEKAFLLFALGAVKENNAGLDVSLEGYAGAKAGQTRFTFDLEALEAGASFSVGEEGAPAFANLLVTGVPEQAPPPVSENLRVDKAYYALSGKKIDTARVSQGDLMVVELTITPEEKRLNPVIVADLLPAGFEIEGLLGPADGVVEYGTNGILEWIGEIDAAQTKQAQDDRFVAAIDVYDKPVRLAYLARAVTRGEFALPGVVAEDMYRADVFARSKASRAVIVAKSAEAGGAQ